MRDIGYSDTGVWEGEAAEEAEGRRKKLVTDGTDLASEISGIADAHFEAADTLFTLKGDMTDLGNHALSKNFKIWATGQIEDLQEGWGQADPRRWAGIRASLRWSIMAIEVRLGNFDWWFASRFGGFRKRLADQLAMAKGSWDILISLSNDPGKHVLAFGAGLFRFMDAASDVPRWQSDLFLRGELPELAEVLATQGYLSGLAVGTLGNLITGEDLKLFDDGKPYTGEPIVVSESDGQRLQNASDWTRDMRDVYGTRPDQAEYPDGRPNVEITVVENPGEPPRIMVTVPGTTESFDRASGWLGGAGGTDWPANLKHLGMGSTSSTQAIMDAVDKVAAKYPGATEVVMGGHSQGGIIAANMAADPGFANRYDIKGVMTVGSPIQTIPIPQDVPVVSVNNEKDVVAASDFEGAGGSRDTDNIADVTLRSGKGEYNLHDHHGQNNYVRKMDEIMEEGQSKWTADESPIHDFDSKISPFYASEDGRTTTYHVEVGRQSDR